MFFIYLYNHPPPSQVQRNPASTCPALKSRISSSFWITCLLSLLNTLFLLIMPPSHFQHPPYFLFWSYKHMSLLSPCFFLPLLVSHGWKHAAVAQSPACACSTCSTITNFFYEANILTFDNRKHMRLTNNVWLASLLHFQDPATVYWHNYLGQSAIINQSSVITPVMCCEKCLLWPRSNIFLCSSQLMLNVISMGTFG